MMMERVRGDEDGAVAVLYSIVIMLMLGMLAVVIDLGAMRADRRQAQSVSDLAAVAGAMDLVSDTWVNPRAACVTAFEYVLENTVGAPTTADTSFCHVFPTALTQDCVDYDPVTAVYEEDAFEYLVAITWPIPEDSSWLTSRHPYDAEADGDSQCDRLAVQVARTRGFIFGGVFAQTEGQIAAPAVARSTIRQGDELVAALVVLDPFACNVLRAQGGGSVHVFENRKLDEEGELEIGPGIIAVDSDATTDCSNWPVIALNNPNNNAIYAGVVDEDGNGLADLDGTGRPLIGDGIIFSWAIKAGRRGLAYNAADVSAAVLAGGDDEPPLPGNPPVAGERVLREPWLHRYDCRDTYDTFADAHIEVGACPGDPEEGVLPGSQYVTALRDRIDGAAVVNVGSLEAPVLRYEDTKGDLYVIVNQGPGNRCDLTAYQSAHDPDLFAFPSGANWWFDCNLDAQSNKRVIIPDGNVVIMGDLSLQGALAINTTSAGPDDEDGQDNWVYVRGGWSKSAGATLRLGNPSPSSQSNEGGTFVLMGGPPDSLSAPPQQLSMTGTSPVGSTFNVEGTHCDTRWVDPVPGAADLTWTPCHYTWIGPYNGDFEDLALWSEYDNITNKPHTMGGTVSNLITDGVFYMPNAMFDFGGSGQMGQQRAQFVAYRLLASGGGALRIKPDPDRAAKIKQTVPELIR